MRKMSLQTKCDAYHKATLPIINGLNLNSKEARALGEELSGSYCFAEPFPHIVIDNFLPLPFIEEIHHLFPKEILADDQFYENDYSGLHKRQVLPESCGQKIREIFHFFNSAPVLQFLEGLTTIESLIGDPYFNGGGFHEIFCGGKLGIHADFRINEQLHLNRRINMLIYLNKNWNPDFGGNLELWDRQMRSKVDSIAPLFNRCVIFNTDADSYHGHPDPLNTPAEITRKSIALYYYTASKKVYEDTPAHSTMFVARPQDSSHIKRLTAKLRLQNYLKDWIPPIAYRALVQLKKIIKR
jgi:Rps23 Pro-64 3,4-dihydroxylase Tpa1-like proline 4-hydroxylase